jgi:hypothetical protein
VRDLASVPGVTKVDFSALEGAVTLAIEFDRSAVDPETVVGELVRRLESSQDPLYEGPVQVRYEGG